MRRRYNPYALPPWLRYCRGVTVQIIIPLTIFQGVRTIFLPTTFDVILLAILILLSVSFRLEWL
ncbi:hypothetical protein JOC85_001419 [Bacillus mesophilus]|uniref:Uncharacterized protein n=1 Tax=Bacillus mesophilus TaxID=1808955 RepID=A0A6M0Q647_9BACI|nr:hypothetical protein [Bacillus mesophilus]MBM7660647.1 hypothetical protein [Bacillus mesophilus]NEY71805.1 hypothetical protein [Bacillus mesophilus]